MENTSYRLESCSFIKTVLMMLVVLGHSMSFWNENWFVGKPIISSQGLSILGSWIGSFHIYAFTLISGYIFAFKMMGGHTNNLVCFSLIK